MQHFAFIGLYEGSLHNIISNSFRVILILWSLLHMPFLFITSLIIKVREKGAPSSFISEHIASSYLRHFQNEV